MSNQGSGRAPRAPSGGLFTSTIKDQDWLTAYLASVYSNFANQLSEYAADTFAVVASMNDKYEFKDGIAFVPRSHFNELKRYAGRVGFDLDAVPTKPERNTQELETVTPSLSSDFYDME